MGKVRVEVRVQNLNDLEKFRAGELPADQVRQVVVPDALVDSGATMFSLPTALIQRLGLQKRRDRRIRSATGVGTLSVYSPVELTIQGRDCTVEVMEVPDGTPVLVGQLALEPLDFVIDMKNQRLIGNPEHDGELVLDMY